MCAFFECSCTYARMGMKLTLTPADVVAIWAQGCVAIARSQMM